MELLGCDQDARRQRAQQHFPMAEGRRCVSRTTASATPSRKGVHERRRVEGAARRGTGPAAVAGSDGDASGQDDERSPTRVAGSATEKRGRFAA